MRKSIQVALLVLLFSFTGFQSSAALGVKMVKISAKKFEHVPSEVVLKKCAGDSSNHN